MQEQLISSISECIILINQLETQLSENEESFSHCFSKNLHTLYSKQNQEARNLCAQMKKKLFQLQESEQAKLLAQMQAGI